MKLCIGQWFMNKLCTGQWFMNKLCTGQWFMNKITDFIPEFYIFVLSTITCYDNPLILRICVL
jgi:hypothetical protein